MSIVICAIDKNRRFYIASDLRAICAGVVSDDYQKVFELKPRVYFGMTGIAEAGLYVLKYLRTFVDLSTEDLTAKANDIIKPSSTKLAVMLAGQNEEDNFFIWQKNNDGVTTVADVSDSAIAYSISATNKIGEFDAHFCNLVGNKMSLEKAISNTIIFASTIDQTISPTYKMIKLDRTG